MTGIKRNKPVIILAIAVLVALNVWRWWPSQLSSSRKDELSSARFHLDDFEVRALPADFRTPMLRDLFHPKRPVAAKPVAKIRANAVPAAPVKSPEELAHDAAQAEFAQIRCVGISVRDNRIQAYLFDGGDPFLVSAGDKVGSRFIVEKIVPEGVVVRDSATGVGGQIAVSGK